MIDTSRPAKDPVLKLVRQVRVRLFVRNWIRWTLRGLFAASVLALLYVVAARMFPQIGEPIFPVIALFIAGYVLGAAIAIVRRPSMVDAALAADQGFGLRERLTTTLELGSLTGAMVDAVRQDTHQKILGLSVRQAVPMSIGSRARWVYLPLLALGLAYVFLPEFDLLKHNERMAEAKTQREAVAVHVERIRAAVDPLEEGTTPGEASAMNKITAELNKLANDLDAGALTEKQAIAKLEDLAKTVAEHQKNLADQGAAPKLAADTKEFGVAKDVAKALQEGRLSDAAAEAKKLMEKLQDGKLSEQERKKAAADLKKLSEALATNPSQMSEALSEALAKASASLESGDLKAASEAMKVAEMSLQDIDSVMQQLEKMNVTMANLAQWKGNMMGASEYCRACGMKMSECHGGTCCTSGNSQCSGAAGNCQNGSCNGNKMGQGAGLRGPGRGQGNQIGQQPEFEAGFQPTKAPGPTTKGKMLADLLQRSAPETGEEATVDFISGSFEQLEQEAEQALTQEDIPPGAKEFVRQYFGDIEPEKAAPKR